MCFIDRRAYSRLDFVLFLPAEGIGGRLVKIPARPHNKPYHSIFYIMPLNFPIQQGSQRKHTKELRPIFQDSWRHFHKSQQTQNKNPASKRKRGLKF